MDKLLKLLNIKLNNKEEFKDALEEDRLGVYLASRSKWFNTQETKMKKSY